MNLDNPSKKALKFLKDRSEEIHGITCTRKGCKNKSIVQINLAMPNMKNYLDVVILCPIHFVEYCQMYSSIKI